MYYRTYVVDSINTIHGILFRIWEDSDSCLVFWAHILMLKVLDAVAV